MPISSNALDACAPKAALWFPVNVIDNFIGDRVSTSKLLEIITWPTEHRESLLEALSAAAYNSTKESTELSGSSLFQVDTILQANNSHASINHDSTKQHLLYFDNIIYADHFGKKLCDKTSCRLTLNTYDVASRDSGAESKSIFDWWLISLADILPAIRSNAVLLSIAPNTELEYPTNLRTNFHDDQFVKLCIRACRDYSQDLSRARHPLNVFDLTIQNFFDEPNIPHDIASYFATYADMIENKHTYSDKSVLRYYSIDDLEHGDSHQVSDWSAPWQYMTQKLVASFISLIHHSILPDYYASLSLEAHALFGSISSTSIMQCLGFPVYTQTLPTKNKRAGTLLSTFKLPGIASVNVNEIVSIRNCNEAFYDFRRMVGKLLTEVDSFTPQDQAQFESDLLQAAQDYLVPEIEKINTQLKKKLFENIFIPCANSLSAGALVYLLGKDFPLSALTSASMVPISYGTKALINRLSPSGKRNKAALKAFIRLNNLVGNKS